MAPQRFAAEDVDPSPLGEPLKFAFSGLAAKNRFMKGAMTERLSTWDPEVLEKRGIPTPELINVYRRWGEGGFGVILSGNLMIEYDHLEAAGNPIIPHGAPMDGERFEAFQALAAAAKKEGSLFLAQLSHPGRQVAENVQPHPISASDVQLEGNVMGMTFAKPRAMEKKDIERVVEGFAHAAEYAHKAGFDGVQLHGAQYVHPASASLIVFSFFYFFFCFFLCVWFMFPSKRRLVLTWCEAVIFWHSSLRHRPISAQMSMVARCSTVPESSSR